MEAEFLHAGLGWLSASSIVALSFITSLISASFGLGGGMVMLAVLANLLPAPAIIPVHGVVQLGSNISRVSVLFSHVDRSVLLPFAFGALVGVALGGMIVVQVPAATLQVAIGLFILWSVFLSPPAFLRKSNILVGIFSSFLTMFIGGTGPFVAAFVKTLGLGRLQYVATHASLMTLQHLLKCLAFGVLGFSFGKWLPLVAMMIAAGFLGTVCGRAVLTRIDERRFRIGLNILLAILALRLIASGGLDLVQRMQAS